MTGLGDRDLAEIAMNVHPDGKAGISIHADEAVAGDEARAWSPMAASRSLPPG